MRTAYDRLIRRAQFQRVTRTRQSAATPGLVLQIHRRPGDTAPARVGLTASRKVGNAVCRNRARRRLRAIAGTIIPRHAAPGHDYVMIARRGTVDRPYRALVRDLESALKRLNVWQNEK